MQPGEWQVKMRQALINAVSEDDIREIMEGLVARAKQGDRDAIKVVLSYVGQPPTTTHLRVNASANGKQRRALSLGEVVEGE